MKTKDLFDEISKDALSNKVLKDNEKLEEGQTMWLEGIPLESEKETISLNVGLNEVIVIKSKDILDVIKGDKMYYIKVKKGTKFIFKIELISEISDENNCCNYNNKAEIKLGKNKNQDTPIIIGATNCRYTFIMYFEYVWVIGNNGLPHPVRVVRHVIKTECD